MALSAATVTGCWGTAVDIGSSLQEACVAVHRIIVLLPFCFLECNMHQNSPLHPKALRYLAAVAELGSVQAAARGISI